MTVRPAGLVEDLPLRLRRAGLAVTAEMTRDFLQALAVSRFDTPAGLYWIARTVFLKQVDALPRFDHAFRDWLHGLTPPDFERPADEAAEDELRLDQRGSEQSAIRLHAGDGGGREAADADGVGGKRVEATPSSLRERARAVAEASRAAMPRRQSRRREPARRGPIDLARTLRGDRALAGEFKPPVRRDRPNTPRRLLMLIDVSGSMTSVSLDALRVAHAMMRVLPATEVFCFGTRLTRVTGRLRRVGLDPAMERLAADLRDWDGGTRIGDSLAAFLERSQHAALVRGAVAVIVSDGFERGDPAAMARATARLSRLAHRLIWASPMLADPRYRPRTRAMQAVLPMIDRLADASSIEAWTCFPAALAAAEAGPRGAAVRQLP